MLDEVVSFILAAPVDSTSEVLDECAVPSDFPTEQGNSKAGVSITGTGSVSRGDDSGVL